MITRRDFSLGTAAATLGLGSTAELVRYALEHKLLD